MKTITVNGEEYKLEYTFEAAECKEVVQKMFDMATGTYISKRIKSENDSAYGAMISGTSEMIADIPHVCKIAFYAGLLENNPMSEHDAKKIMKAYMLENNLSYRQLFEEIKTMMEGDGFFDLSGLTEAVQSMAKSMKEQTEGKKKPTARTKKVTGMK